MDDLVNWIVNLITSMDSFGIVISCFLILIESIFPPLPLALFVTILFLNYGPFIGLVCSWFFTVLGCTLSFYLFKTIFKKYVDKKIRNYKFANNFLSIVDDLKFSYLVLLLAAPFTPAFAINILSGVSNMSIKKFLPAIMIGKIFMILFWGYIGTSFIDSLQKPIILIKIIFMFGIAFFLSKIIAKKLKLD